MQTYRIQEMVETDWSNLETILGIVVLVLLIATGLASVPIPARMAGDEPVPGLRREKQRVAEIQELRTRNENLNGELSRLSKDLVITQTDLGRLQTLHAQLVLQVSEAKATLQEMGHNVENNAVQSEKLQEYAARYAQLERERDEALAQAEVRAEQIRQLTLSLQRARVIP